jgi:hypothetical protein
MIEYNYLEGQTLEELNTLGLDDWQVINVLTNESPQSFDVFLQKGRAGYNLIEVDSETDFYISKDFSLGESAVLIFIVITLIVAMTKMVYGFIFKND